MSILLRYVAAIVAAGLIAIPANGLSRDAESPASSAPSYTKADYWHVMDSVYSSFLKTRWNDITHVYDHWTWSNSFMLTFHAIRASAFGDPEDKRRARLLVDVLTSPDAFDGQTWHHMLRQPLSDTHPALDAVCAEALWAAYMRRDSICLGEERERRICETIDRVVEYRLGERGAGTSQRGIRWNADLLRYSYDTGRAGRVEDWIRIAENALYCLDHAEPRCDHYYGPAVQGVLHPDWTWVYHPFEPDDGVNWNTLEYDMKCFSGLVNHAYFIREGLYSVSDEEREKIRSWSQHILGSWQLNGYLNWDTGYAASRFSSAQYWAWALKALIPLIICDDCAARDRRGGEDLTHRYAKYVLDRAVDQFRTFDSFNDVAGDHAIGPSPYGIVFRGKNSKGYNHNKVSTNALFLAHLALAADVYDVGRVVACNPSTLWRYDWFIGKLAVSTQRYSASIVARNFGSFPYAGGELTTLQDSRGYILTNLKPGRQESSFNFGYVVEDSAGNRFAGNTFNAGARMRPGEVEGIPLFQIMESPEGLLADLQPYSPRRFQPTFNLLRAVATYRLGAARASLTHLFLKDAIVVDESFAFPEKVSVHSVSKTIPVSHELEEVYARTVNGGRVRIVERLRPVSRCPDLRSVKFVHYRSVTKGTGFLVVPLRDRSSFGRSFVSPVTSAATVDPWNPVGVRGIEYRILSEGDTVNAARFSFLLAFTDGSEECAERTYDFYTSGCRLRAKTGRPVLLRAEPFDVRVSVAEDECRFTLDNGHSGDYTVTLSDLFENHEIRAASVAAIDRTDGARAATEDPLAVAECDRRPDGTVVFRVSTGSETTSALIAVSKRPETPGSARAVE